MYNWSLKEQLPILKTVGVNRIRSLKNPFSDQSNSSYSNEKKKSVYHLHKIKIPAIIHASTSVCPNKRKSTTSEDMLLYHYNK